MEARRGELVVVTGGSGGGKSTLAHCLNGLIPHFYGGHLSGRVAIGGRTTSTSDVAHLAASVGIVFQNPDGQMLTTTVESEVAFGAENLGFPGPELRRRVDGAINRFRLSALRAQSIDRLSGGQKQMVAVASAVAMGVEALVMDEPFSNLDPSGMDLVAGEVAALAEDGTAVVVFEHRLERLLPLADRLVVLSRGSVIYDGAAEPEPASPVLEEPVEWPSRLALRRILARGVGVGTGDQRRDEDPSPPAPPDGEVLVRCQDLWYSYAGGPPVLQGIDLVLRSGRVVAVMGPNGSGKTTLVKHLNGLLRGRQGTVEVAGVRVASRSVAQMARTVGLVFQVPLHSLFCESVGREVEFGPRNLGFPPDLARRRARNAVAELGIDGLWDRSPFTLSGGEQQRVAIAAVLALDPRLLVLDEPTIGMDAGNKALLGGVLRRIARTGRLVVLVTHDTEFAARFADEVVVLMEGRVKSHGAAREVLTNLRLLEGAGLKPPGAVRLSAAMGVEPPCLTVEELAGRLADSGRGLSR